MPCPADDGDAREACFLRGANTLAHMGLASCLVFIFRGGVPSRFPHFGHGLQDTVEQVGHVAALLDLAFPPEFVVVVARRFRQQVEGLFVGFFIGGRAITLFHFVL